MPKIFLEAVYTLLFFAFPLPKKSIYLVLKVNLSEFKVVYGRYSVRAFLFPKV